MSMITNSARFLLFGPKLGAEITLQAIVKRKGSNLVRGAFGMPPSRGPGFTDWLLHVLKEAWASLWGISNQAPGLPADMPVALFKAVDTTLRNRGGLANRELDTPNYWLDQVGATSTPFFWSLVVEYAPTADPAKVSSFEMALEDAITRAGFDYNVRIQRRPLRIEIDKPAPPTITLAELWPQVIEYPQNSRQSVLGLAYMNGQSTTLGMTLEGEDFSAFIAASSGGGKTQLAMSILLSLAMTNSPSTLTMILIDPKAVDFRPFNALPHLAGSVLNEPVRAAEVVQMLCDEMDKRTAQAGRGDNSFFAHSILLYIDELADLIMSLPDAQAQALTNNVQRLGQKGRGVGFVLICCTQRVYDVPANAHTKLNARIVGKMRTAGDSVAASGIPGTTTNKLPGRGSFELYCSDQTGLRIQAPFVASSDKPGYEKALQPFFDDINARWQGSRPGWLPPTKAIEPADVGAVATKQPTEPAQETEPIELLQVDARLWQAMIDAHQAGKLTANAVRKMHAGLLGKSIDGYKAKDIFDAFLGAQQPQMANSGDD